MSPIFYSFALIFVFLIYLEFSSSQKITERIVDSRVRRQRVKFYGADEPFVFKGDFRRKQTQPQRSARLSQSNKRCGIYGQGIFSGPRVVRGRPAAKGEFPWQVGLYSKTEDKFEHVCGGAILTPQWVVTAAHCVVKNKPEELKGVVGVNDLEKVEANNEIFFDRVIVHSNYTVGPERELINDIALLHVNKPIDFSSQWINSICLPKRGETSYKAADVTGWGQTEEHGFSTNILQTAVVYPFREIECVRRYKKKYHRKEMLCAGLRRGGRDACRGDSGGPLTQSKGSSNYLIGIVSFGVGCARKDFPGMYTRVSNYVDWINKHIGQ